MRKYDVIETIGLLIIYSLIYFLLDFSFGFAKYTHIVAFLGTALIAIVFQEWIKRFIRFTLSRQIRVMFNSAIQTLESVNTQLNKSVRYHDVTRELSKTFDKLFVNAPFGFYILDENIYHLTHFGNIPEDVYLPGQIENNFFTSPNKLNLRVDDINRNLNALIPRKTLKQLDLTSILLFPGHTHVIAFLLLNPKRIPIFNYSDTRDLFEKIQKKAGLILENTALYLDLEQRNFEISKLFEVSEKVLSSLDLEKVLDFILSSIKSLINYDAAVIYLLDRSGKKLIETSSTGYETGLLNKLHMKVGQGACGYVVETNEINVIDDVSKAKHYFELRPNTKSQISIPLSVDKRTLGVICLESDEQAFFNKRTVDLLRIYSNQAAIAIHNAQQLDTMLAKKAFEHELIHAGAVQQRLLVQRVPRIEKLKVSISHTPSKIVSGDLYDVIHYNESTIGFAIGDVSGKGAPAALMMTLILAGLRSQKVTFLTVCDMIYRLNNLLFDSTIEGKYATFFFGLFVLDKAQFIYTNAGHNPPLFIKADGTIRRLTKGGLVMGFLSDQSYQQETITFDTGDILVSYTDGITEAMNPDEEEFGEERLIELIKTNRHLTVHEMKEKIIDDVNAFAEHANPSDDMTLVIFKHT